MYIVAAFAVLPLTTSSFITTSVDAVSAAITDPVAALFLTYTLFSLEKLLGPVSRNVPMLPAEFSSKIHRIMNQKLV